MCYDDDTYSTGARHIAAALKDQEKKPRIVMCTSAGVSETSESNSLFMWLLKYPLADKKLAEANLRASGCPLVIVRPSRLMDLPPRGLTNLAAVENGPVPYAQISRADVAAFMIAQTLSDVWLGRAVTLGWNLK